MSRPEDDDVALKLLHTADWHLGMRFPQFSDSDQMTLMRARMDVLDAIFATAEQHRVDAVLCAGDLFDDPAVEEVWWRGLVDKLKLRAWTDRPVFLLPGNHDPLTPRSIYHPGHPFRAALPEGVHVVDRDDFEFALSDDAVLVAAPCRNAAGSTGMWAKLPPRPEGDTRIRIGMIHGQTVDIPGHQNTFPIPKDAAELRGLDYLALGDTHAFREVVPGARAPTIYPGAPEPTRFGEEDAGHVAVVLFPRGGRRPIVRAERVGRWRWEERTCTSLAELRTLTHDDGLRSTVLRLLLKMTVDAPGYDEVESALRTLGGTDATHGRAGVLQVDREGLRLDTADLDTTFEELPEVLRAAVARLRTAEQDPDQADVAGRALYHLYRLVKEA